MERQMFKPQDSKQASQLYQALILEHNKSPCGYGLLADATHRHDGFNPICGDKVTVTVRVDGGAAAAIGFESQSCALCRASASVMTKVLVGHSIGKVRELIGDFESMILKDGAVVSGEAAILAAIKDFPARAKCVILPWRTLVSALQIDVSKQATSSLTTRE